MERVKGAVTDEGCAGDGQHKEEEEEVCLGLKLRKGISAKRGGTSTPVPTWKVDEDDQLTINHDNSGRNHRKSTSNTVADTAVSARKLGANLWEFQDLLPLPRMSRRGGGRCRHGQRKGHKHLDLLEFLPVTPHDRTHGARADGWNAAASLIQRNKSSERNAGPLQPVSPASYNSSLEMAAYNHDTPTSSLGFKGRLGESGCGLKTSTELLKVLKHIWNLEEKHASNVSMMKAMKFELDHANMRIQELVEERQVNRCEIDNLLKKLAENNLVRKSKEWEKMKVAVHSLKDEVEGERRLRKHSENLHWKLAKEFSEVKSLYSKALIDLEKERNLRGLLEDLCDEFARGIVEYEQEVQELKQKSEMDYVRRCDRLILHISEEWLDKRLQMKLAESRGDSTEINTIIYRLGCEIERFLQARQANAFGNGILAKKDYEEDNFINHQSLESVHLNGAASAPQEAEDDDSVTGDLHCFELDMGSNCFAHARKSDVSEKSDARKPNMGKKKVGCAERMAGRRSSNAHLQFEEQNERPSTSNGNKIHLHYRGESEGRANHSEFLVPNKTESEQWNCHDATDNTVDNSSKGQLELSDACKVEPGSDPLRRRQPTVVGLDTATCDARSVSSPVQPWKYRGMPPDTQMAESSSKLQRRAKENTLKAKLLEARLEGQHARLRPSKGASFFG